MIGSGDQLPLGLGHPPALSRADFVVGDCNRDALAVIEAWPDWPANALLLAGPEGSGKTHLVEIWAEISGALMTTAKELGGRNPRPLTADAPIAVEDIDRGGDSEIALFHLLNEARERGTSVLLTAREPGVAGKAKLPDLASRFRAARPARLTPPDDEFLKRVLVKLFSDRQLVASSPLLDYLVRRMERSFAAAALLVDKIDEAALASGRPLSRQLAASVLSALGGEDALDPTKAK